MSAGLRHVYDACCLPDLDVHCLTANKPPGTACDQPDVGGRTPYVYVIAINRLASDASVQLSVHPSELDQLFEQKMG